MAHIVDHLNFEELGARSRASEAPCAARHYQAIWLLARGRTLSEVAATTGLVQRWLEQLAQRYNRFGPDGAGHGDPVRDRVAPEGCDRGVAADPGRRGGHGHRATGPPWVNGLPWADLAGDLVVRKATTKTDAFAAHDPKLCPPVVALLDLVSADRRVGPLFVDELAGRPYAESAYGREWRIVARAAGVPDHVWNMDARAGAITEAEDENADLDHIRSAAAHARSSTMLPYSRGAVGKSRAVAVLRTAHRAGRNEP